MCGLRHQDRMNLLPAALATLVVVVVRAKIPARWMVVREIEAGEGEYSKGQNALKWYS